MGDASPEKEHILCLLPFPEDEKILKSIKDKHPNVEFTYRHILPDHGGIKISTIPDDLMKEATILVTLSKLPSPELAVNLKLIHLFSAGADRVLSTPIWKEGQIPFTNSSGVHSPQISEWVVLQILSHAHRQKMLLKLQKDHIWGSFQDVGFVRDGVGQRLGVLGYGAIGRQTARVARALGMDVIAYTASPRTTPESKRDHGYIVDGTGDPDGSIPSAWYSGLDKASLRHFLSQDIDILLISVPLTPQTKHFIAAEELQILGEKKNAFIVNIARGAIINQDDLIAALKKKPAEGGLRGAALDVTEPEPLPEESELWDLENVAITPHVSGLGTTYAERSFEILDINLTNLEQGRPLINVVDRRKGY
ncbi:Uncharacterized protein BP5553_01862 [Venustampulla echinocandica]|uniref:D-isomer specific 2-hydroxyacid dehydrogenase NAD-binding domain-containing protein n=1 Tax=Venustampulla echinocandica TaxID=2656787 RepID=A0A370U2B9_9HELO|nr:Uncharacterized protein BP5553_01862 [Venustampulla echinocandica]RDL41883.1 Uncharacterized protein BP5553_01862 [Venustampulla echinocandica]